MCQITVPWPTGVYKRIRWRLYERIYLANVATIISADGMFVSGVPACIIPPPNKMKSNSIFHDTAVTAHVQYTHTIIVKVLNSSRATENSTADTRPYSLQFGCSAVRSVFGTASSARTSKLFTLLFHMQFISNRKFNTIFYCGTIR